jgi:competence protein ComEC
VGGICARGPPLYLLNVAHHGSGYSTSSEFLADTDPRFAVISVGANSYSHPTPETVARLRRSGARVHTTRRNGTITLLVSTSGAVKWRFTRSSKPVAGATAP